MLERQGFTVSLLLDKQASRSGILKTVRNLAKSLEVNRSTNARVLVYFAGHGFTESVGGKDYGYLIPWDATQDSDTHISMDEVRDLSQRLDTARHQLYLLDSCFGGLVVTRDPVGLNSAVPGYLEDAQKRKAIQVLTAGGKNQQVVDNGPNGHSPFTNALLEAIDDGLADTVKDGFISFSELTSYVEARASNAYQTPGPATLPGHGQGQFLFRARITKVAPTVTPLPIIGSPARRSPDLVLTAGTKLDLLCTAGNAASCRDLGFMYARGEGGVKPDDYTAVALYRKACDGGDARGCSYLGDMYYSGRGTGGKGDNVSAAKHYQTACNAQYQDACVALQKLTPTSARVPAPPSNVRTQGPIRPSGGTPGLNLNELCSAGNAASCTDLGFMYARGEGGVKPDDYTAVALYRKACDGGDARGCSYLGDMYYSGRGTGGKGDNVSAAKYYQTACNAQYQDACVALQRLKRR